MKNIQFSQDAFKQFIEWQKMDEDIFDKISELIRDVSRDPFKGIGKPEALKGNFKGFWSRRINQKHRLIYQVESDNIFIHSCYGHYDD